MVNTPAYHLEICAPLVRTLYFAHEIRFLCFAKKHVAEGRALRPGQERWLADLAERALRAELKMTDLAERKAACLR